MLQTFLTGLREGLEAALVVSILLSFLVKTGHKSRVPALWGGVGTAVVASLLAGAVLHFSSAYMSFRTQEVFGGVLSILAVAFVTWMVFWMKRTAKSLKGDLQTKLTASLEIGATGVFLAAFLAVGREGLETALFLYPTFQAQGGGYGPALGAVLGIATAIVIGLAIYRGSVRLNLGKFFRYTGAALVVIAAGVLAYGVHDLQEASVLPGLTDLAWNIEGFRPTSWYGTLIKGIFNLSPQMSKLEVLAYFTYLVPVMILFLRPSDRSSTQPPTQAATELIGSVATTQEKGNN